jgi:hypothetical protein
MPYPYLGKTVHYTAAEDEGYGTTCRAAMVTNVLPVDPNEVPPGTYVNLLVVDDTGTRTVPAVEFSESEPSPAGTWHEAETGF